MEQLAKSFDFNTRLILTKARYQCAFYDKYVMQVVNHLGQAVLAALDYGLAVDEQHLLAEDLYDLISCMTGGHATSSDDDHGDEGCGNKSQEGTVDDVILVRK